MEERPISGELPRGFDKGLVIYPGQYRRWFWKWAAATGVGLLLLALVFQGMILNWVAVLVEGVHEASERHGYEGVLRIAGAELGVLFACLLAVFPAVLVIGVGWWMVRLGKRIQRVRQRFGFVGPKEAHRSGRQGRRPDAV
jgi:hypothetical protein